MLQLIQHVAAISEHSRTEDAREFRQTFVTQPQVAEQKGQPDVHEHEVLQALVRECLPPEIDYEQQPGGRIKQRGLNIPDEAEAAINGWVPLGEPPVTDGLKGVIGQRIVEMLEIVGNVDAPERRKVVKEEQISENERECRNHSQSNGFRAAHK